MKRYIKNGEIKYANKIVLRTTKDGKRVQIINPTEEMILADGWVEYVAPTTTPSTTPRRKSKFEIVEELVTKQYNERTDIENNEALEYMTIIYPWSHYLNQTLKKGMLVVYDDKPWRVRQEHVALDIYPPSLDTASLYEAIDKEHEGTIDDPIPYIPPMEIFEGKYYIQNEVVYICTRNSETALSHNLSELVGLYVSLT